MDRARVKKVVFPIVTLGLVSIFCFVILEAYARLVQPKEDFIGQQGEPVVLYELDPILGWTLASQPVRHKTFEFDVTYNLTARRMNDEWSAADASKKRIVVLGDSHTFGYGLSGKNAWPNVLEQDLSERKAEPDTPPVVVYNLGVPGYGVDQYYLRLREDGWRLNPSIVVLGFSPNDIIGILGNPAGRSYFTIDQDSGELVENTGRAVPAVKSANFSFVQLLQRSIFVRQLVRTSAFYWFAARFQEATGRAAWPTKEPFFRKVPNAEEQHSWELIQKLIERIYADCEARGVPLVVVFIPHLYHVYDDLWDSSLGNFPADYDRMIMNKLLADLVVKTNGHFVDPSAALKSFVETTGKWVTFKYDGHINSEGSEIIAREVADYLANRNLFVETNGSH